jgi:hypothetical protein
MNDLRRVAARRDREMTEMKGEQEAAKAAINARPEPKPDSTPEISGAE